MAGVVVLNRQEQAFIDHLVQKVPAEYEFAVQEKVLDLLHKDPHGHYAREVIRTWIAASRSGQPEHDSESLFMSTVCACALRQIVRVEFAERVKKAPNAALAGAVKGGTPWEREAALTEFIERARRTMEFDAFTRFNTAVAECDPSELGDFILGTERYMSRSTRNRLRRPASSPSNRLYRKRENANDF